jgi:hypothetical protein
MVRDPDQHARNERVTRLRYDPVRHYIWEEVMSFRAAIVLATGMTIQFTGDVIFAHHSFSGEFDNSMAVTLQGVVTSVEMINPHSFIYLDVKVHGAVERWRWRAPLRCRSCEGD